MTEKERKDKIKRLNWHLDQLAEHFDAVTILASYSIDGHTASFTRTAGDYYAAIGLAHRFLAEDDEDTRERVRNDELPDTGEDDDPLGDAQWI